MSEQNFNYQRASEYAQILHKTDSPTEENVQAALERHEILSQAYEDVGLNKEEAKDKAFSQLEEDLIKNPKSSLSPVIKAAAKAVALIKAEEGVVHMSAEDVYSYLRENHNYKAKSTRGIGDVLGHGHKGLCLEALPNKVNGRKVYKTPDPAVFSDWYTNDIYLPREYYTAEGWLLAVRKEAKKPKSLFLFQRNQ